MRGAIETTALVSLAYARVRPEANELEGAVGYLSAHRTGTGWRPYKAKGPALARSFLLRACTACRRPLPVDGDGQRHQAGRAECERCHERAGDPGSAQGLESRAVQSGALDLEGRGRFGYAVTLSGLHSGLPPDQNRANRVAFVSRRVDFPGSAGAPRQGASDGFDVAVKPETFENVASQVGARGKAHVVVTVHRNIPASTPEWERDFLIVEENLPAARRSSRAR